MASKLPNIPDSINDILYLVAVIKGKQKYCGYKRDYLVRNLSEMEESFVVCKVCCGIMREASLCDGETTCLFCSETPDKLNAVNNVHNSVAQFEIICPILRNCKWKGKLSEAEIHLEFCDNFLIECVKCGEIFPRKEEESHISDICPMRKICCKYGCEKSGYAKDLEKHEEVCAKIPILCQNGCGMEFPREDTSEHRDVCELEEITCPYTKYGCKAKPMLRRDLLAHKKENIVEHTDMSLNRIEKLENEKKIIEWTMKDLDKFEWEFQFTAFSHFGQIDGPTFYINNYKLRLYIMRTNPQTKLSYNFTPRIETSFSIKRIEGEFDKQLGIAAITHYRVNIVDIQNYKKSYVKNGPMNYQLKIGENSEVFCSIDEYTWRMNYVTADHFISIIFYFDINTQPPLEAVPEDNPTMLTSSKTSDIDPFN